MIDNWESLLKLRPSYPTSSYRGVYMGLSPAHTCRTLDKVPWTRYSKRKPSKNYIKAMPHSTVQIFVMGNPKKTYDLRIDLVAQEDVQIRDCSLESARQTVNKYIETRLPGAYLLKVLVYPHNVIRENKMILGAGADRLQKGMRNAYGRPSDRAARVHSRQPIFRLFIESKHEKMATEAFRRARLKLPGKFKLKVNKND